MEPEVSAMARGFARKAFYLALILLGVSMNFNLPFAARLQSMFIIVEIEIGHKGYK